MSSQKMRKQSAGESQALWSPLTSGDCATPQLMNLQWLPIADSNSYRQTPGPHRQGWVSGSRAGPRNLHFNKNHGKSVSGVLQVSFDYSSYS